MIEQNKISWEEKIKLIFDEDNWEKNRDLINLCNSELSTEFTDGFIKYIDEKISSLNKKCNDLQNKKEELNKKEEELLNEKELLNMKYIDLTTIKEAINKKITFMKREYWKKAMCRSEEQEQSILNKFYEKKYENIREILDNDIKRIESIIPREQFEEKKKQIQNWEEKIKLIFDEDNWEEKIKLILDEDDWEKKNRFDKKFI